MEGDRRLEWKTFHYNCGQMAIIKRIKTVSLFKLKLSLTSTWTRIGQGSSLTRSLTGKTSQIPNLSSFWWDQTNFRLVKFRINWVSLGFIFAWNTVTNTGSTLLLCFCSFVPNACQTKQSITQCCSVKTLKLNTVE